METIKIADSIIWDNSKKLSEQTDEAQVWYNENISPLLSYSVPTSIKESAIQRLGLNGEIQVDNIEPNKVSPSEFDGFARPVKWVIEYDNLIITVNYSYMNQNVNWNLNFITVKIECNGEII